MWFVFRPNIQEEARLVRSSLLNLSFWILFCFFSFLPPCLLQPKLSARVVETAYGKVRGIIIPRSGSMPREVEGYLGIPYASAPAASLRFMPPLTPSHWDDVRLADHFGPVCPQLLPDLSNRTRALGKMPLLKYTRLLDLNHLLSNQSEDCLYLNIYMPKPDDERGRRVGGSSSSSTPLAIVVILQGDSWEWGSGSLVDGSALASIGNVVVVTLNYRIGILGFLQTNKQFIHSFAMMDIVASLSWIRENASAFGADPNRVTLLGHRTGAVLANLLMLAPVATELFHRVILLSGSSLSPWSFQRHAKGNIRKIAQYFKCISDSSVPAGGGIHASGGGRTSQFQAGASGSAEVRDLGPCLRDIPLDELLAAVSLELVHPRFISRFGPLIDSALLKSDLVSEMKQDGNGHFSRIQLLIGSASIESFGELNTEDIEDGLQEVKRDRILRTLVRNIFVFHLNEIYSTVKNEYTDWEKPRKDFIDVRDSILSILSDGLTVAPLLQVASMHSHKASAKTFFFHFQYEPDHSVYPHRIGSISEDLLDFSIGQPVLNPPRREPSLPSYTSSDSKVSASVLHYITNFIISGDPNSGYEGSTSVEETQLPYWDSYDPVNQLYLEIGGGEPRMRSHYRGHKMALWLNLIPQLHQSGGTDVSMLHHNFREEKAEFYEGLIREQSKHPPTLPPPISRPKSPRGKGQGVPGHQGSSSSGSSSEKDGEDGEGGEDYETEGEPKTQLSPTISPAVLSSSECPPNSTVNGTSGNGPGEGGTPDRDLVRQLAASHYHSYGTALGVTIGVGCCLLLLNLLIFLAIYHQKTNSTPLPKPREDVEEEQHLTIASNQCRHHHHHHHPSDGHPYCDITSAEEYEDELLQDLRQCGGSIGPQPTAYLHKEVSSSSGFSSPPIPEPPPPPRSSIPPSLAGSMVSITSSNSGGGCGGSGILRRPPERDRESTSGSMKKRVQIQEISV